MSTRAAIIVRDNKSEYNVYHHCDGYPEGVGRELERVYKNCDQIDAAEAKKRLLEYDREYRDTDCIHGDEEYIYVVDTDERKIECYPVTGKHFMNASERVIKETEPLYVQLFDTYIKVLKELKERLKHEVVAFRYFKKDGSKRTAIGTLDSTKSADLANYENSSANYTKNPDVTTYWDVNKNAWRTFKNNLLVDIIS